MRSSQCDVIFYVVFVAVVVVVVFIVFDDSTFCCFDMSVEAVRGFLFTSHSFLARQ